MKTEDTIERVYNHDDGISQWHVREALRELLARIAKLEAQLAAFKAQAEANHA